MLCWVPQKHLWSSSSYHFKERHLEAVGSTVGFLMARENNFGLLSELLRWEENWALGEEDGLSAYELFAQLVGRCMTLEDRLCIGGSFEKLLMSGKIHKETMSSL